MTRFAVRNPITVLVMALILIIAGTMSYKALPRESFPEIKIPLIFVNVIYPGASPEDMERLVTDKLEDKLEGLDGLKKLTSVSSEGRSALQVEFVPDVAVETALRRVKDKVDEAKGELPPDAEDPMVQELNFSNIPIFVISISGDYAGEKLERVSQNLRDEISRVPGVLDAQLTGKQEREIAIDADPAKLLQYNVSIDDIVKAVQGQHRNVPGGTLRAGGNRFSIQLTGEIRDPQKFGDIIVRHEGSPVRIRDVAEVNFGYTRDRSTIFRLNGKNSIAISVTKRTGTNIIEVVDGAKKLVEQHRLQWPQGTNVDYTFDQSVQIRHMVNELQNHIITGLFLVVGFISFFLGFRNSFFISTAIPFSMLMGFLVLDIMGITLNMVVLFSLVIALGMLVDDGIVVVENIYRHREMGKPRKQAAIEGTREVALPVTTATLTTIVAFLPILFMPGMMGEFMKYLPITISVTLTGSLFVAFVFNPVFASLFMTAKDTKQMEGQGSERFERIRLTYKRALGRTLGHPVLVAFASFLFLIGGILAYAFLGSGVVFFPNIEPKVAAAEIEGPLGLDNRITDSALTLIERKLMAMPKDSADVESLSGVVGFGKADMAMGDRAPESHRGYVDVSFTDYEDRKVSSEISMLWMQKNLPAILPGWRVRVKKQQEGPPQGFPVSFEVVGSDYGRIALLADSLKKRLATIPQLVNINWDYDPVQPELRIEVDRNQAMVMGLSASDVAMAVRGAIHGIEAGKFRTGDDEHNIMVRLDPDTRETFAGLDQITIPFEGALIPLSSVAQVTQQANMANIRHLDGERTVQVWAEMAPGVKDESGPKAAALVQAEKVLVPPGYSIRPGSSNRDQDETTEFLNQAFLIAIALVFLTMVFQFNSVSQPLLVIVGIVLSIGGVFWGLLMSNVTFAIMMSGIGIIALAGVVAKNGIVLIDFINQLRREGVPLKEAVLEGGSVRLRPVILTAVTAMLGLLPMATGIGFDFFNLEPVFKSETTMWWKPMAWAIFWGLVFNTILVLMAVPTFYYWWEHKKEKWASKRNRDEGAP